MAAGAGVFGDDERKMSSGTSRHDDDDETRELGMLVRVFEAERAKRYVGKSWKLQATRQAGRGTKPFTFWFVSADIVCVCARVTSACVRVVVFVARPW